MNYQRNSLAYLLKKFCDLTVDKSFQAADWRIRSVSQAILMLLPDAATATRLSLLLTLGFRNRPTNRPLTKEMENYAREDTHYLLYVYDRLTYAV